MTDYDRLIDDAAREITQVPAPVDLRARVIDEIVAGGTSLQARHRNEAEASYHQRWWLAAAAVIILAVYAGWPERRPIDLPTPPPLVVTGPHVGPRPVPASSTAARPATPARGRGIPAPRLPEPTVASIPALETPEALGIAPLDATPEPLPALDAVGPLEIEELNIKPLTSPPAATGGQ